jgi:CHAT domain-containing protein
MRCTSSADPSPGSRFAPAILAYLGLVLLTSASCRRPPPEPPPDSETPPVESPDSRPVSATVEDSAAEPAVGEPILLPMQEGAEVPRHLDGGQVDEFRLDLEAGQFLHLVMEQQGVDVVSTLSDPGGEPVLQVDSPKGNQGSEDLLAVSDQTGAYALRVEAWSGTGSGTYAVKVESLRAAGELDRRRAEAARVFSEAEALRALGNDSAAEAIETYREAVRCFQALGDRASEASALRGLGRVYDQLPGQELAAEDAYSRAIPMLREVGDPWQEAPAAFQLGQIYAARDDRELAIEPLERALELWQRVDSRRGAALAALELGKAHQELGRAQEALTFFERSLEFWRDSGETPESTLAVFQRGEAFLQLGKERQALDDFEKAVAIWEKSGNHRWQMTALREINQVYQRQGRLDLALLALERASTASKHIDDPRVKALLWNETGLLHLLAERPDPAREAFERALEVFQQVGDRAAQGVVLHNIGNARLVLDDPCGAADLNRQALSLWEEVLDAGAVTYKQATFSLVLAKAERQCRGSAAALRYFEQALMMLEELRSRTASLDYRSSYLATQHWFYDEYVDLLMGLHRLEPSRGHDSEAFSISERARARSLLDGLREGEADLRRGADPELIRRERELARQLQAIEQRSLGFNRAEEGGGVSLEEHFRKAQARKRELLRRISEVRARIHLENSQYEALVEAEPLDASEIRSRVLDSGTLLLEYDLGDEQSYLWAISSGSFHSYVLPPGEVIERKARDAYRLLKLSKRRRSIVRAEMAMKELGELLLGPVADLLEGGERMLIVGEGALQYIPFAALTAPGSEVPILADHEIVTMPSASAMAILRSRLSQRIPAAQALAVIADPVFQSHDPRVAERLAEHTGGLQRAAGELDLEGYERLVYSQLEARAILRHLPGSRSKTLLGFEATREAVLDGDLGRYQMIHLATHGVLDEEHPELSRLVLSLVDEAGRRREGGFLFAHEISNLDLPVELVVLSACETALGKEIRGEGLVGLTQSFFYAGAARVLVSLWNVDDYATAELMSRFYENLTKQEMRPAAALRRAQIDMWRQMKAPYYWAPFVMRGEWK